MVNAVTSTLDFIISFTCIFPNSTIDLKILFSSILVSFSPAISNTLDKSSTEMLKPLELNRFSINEVELTKRLLKG